MNIIKKLDPVFKISFVLMIISFMWAKIDMSIVSAIDFRVLAILFSLMLVIESFKEAELFEWASECVINKFKTTRQLGSVLVILAFVSSMFITNDVALITLVPFTILLLRSASLKHILIDVIILETVAANLGSQFTPIGNPQNLYIYSHYNLDIFVFLKHMLIPSIISLLLVLLSSAFIKDEVLRNHLSDNIKIDKKSIAIWSIAFILCLLSVIRFLDYRYLAIILFILALITNRKALLRVDYIVLLTFICLFIFVHNVLQLQYIKEHVIPILQNNVYVSAILFSQFISNVPAAMLFGPLTNDWKTLLYAVNVAGLGTLIASMASIISYKIYAKEPSSNKSSFLIRFSIYNFVLLIILAIIFKLILKFM